MSAMLHTAAQGCPKGAYLRVLGDGCHADVGSPGQVDADCAVVSQARGLVEHEGDTLHRAPGAAEGVLHVAKELREAEGVAVIDEKSDVRPQCPTEVADLLGRGRWGDEQPLVWLSPARVDGRANVKPHRGCIGAYKSPAGCGGSWGLATFRGWLDTGPRQPGSRRVVHSPWREADGRRRRHWERAVVVDFPVGHRSAASKCAPCFGWVVDFVDRRQCFAGRGLQQGWLRAAADDSVEEADHHYDCHKDGHDHCCKPWMLFDFLP
mmetsp:Transcript_7378/g.20829  ORF Transcript_7378/g.20829 Transcript_7378/m.20829 type:complete len:265 (+) Transcript_7378:373-1167(+)